MSLRVRIESQGVSAERGVARLCAEGTVTRDQDAMLGAPAADAICDDGVHALDVLVGAATLALDDTDLHIILQRG